MDIFSKSKHSDIMSNVSGKDTKPDILVENICLQKNSGIEKM